MQFFLRSYKFGRYNISFAAILWFTLTVVALLVQFFKGLPGSINNYLIFKGVFFHTIHQTDLYSAYPAEYGDVNHYGPVFSLLIAPFALLPNILGCFFWGILNASVLFYAVKQLPLSNKNKQIILLIGAVEMMTSMHSVQFNPMLTGFIILSYTFVHKKQELWATLFIALGILTKIYGIAGLAFFLFSGDKVKFILYFIFWMALLFCLPMLISSPAFVLQQYKLWFVSLAEKNELNNESVMQGMTAMRIIKKLFGFGSIKDAHIIITGGVFYLAALVRIKHFKQLLFQLWYLAFLLVGVVIFSSSAEAPTFVIAMMGVGIWFAACPVLKRWMFFLVAFALLLTTFSSTDLFPNFIKATYIRPYGLKALPCLVIWMVLACQLLFNKFKGTHQQYV